MPKKHKVKKEFFLFLWDFPKGHFEIENMRWSHLPCNRSEYYTVEKESRRLFRQLLVDFAFAQTPCSSLKFAIKGQTQICTYSRSRFWIASLPCSLCLHWNFLCLCLWASLCLQSCLCFSYSLRRSTNLQKTLNPRVLSLRQRPNFW